jgi:DNA-binding winged helix-turn-helix (wHTH) protein
MDRPHRPLRKQRQPGGEVGGQRTFGFGEFELDEEPLELRRQAVPLELGVTSLRLLLCLAKHYPALTSKETILGEVWPGIKVSDWALATALKELRQALDDDGEQQRCIRTERKRGYRLVPEVEVRGGTATRLSLRSTFGITRGTSTCFVGRARELEGLHRLLQWRRPTALRIAIEGLAGVGKTELALQVVQRLVSGGTYPGGIFWLDAEASDLRPAWANTIADQYGVPPGSVDDRCAELMHRMQATEAPILVLLDNVTSWTPDKQPRPLPAGAHVHMLATTRVRNFAGTQFEHLPLDVLRAPHDRELLLHVAGRRVDPGVDELLGHLAGHALGLSLAGAFLATFAGESANSYLHALQQNAEATEAEVADRTHYERTVVQAFRTVCDRLSDEDREAWWLGSFFGAEPVLRVLALAGGMNARALRRLEEVHLVQSDEERWSMHPLTRAFGQRLLPDSRRSVQLLLSIGPQLFHRTRVMDEAGAVYKCAFEVAERTGQHLEVLAALDGHRQIQALCGDWRGADLLAKRMHTLAQTSGDEVYCLPAYRALGENSFYMGRLKSANVWLERAIAVEMRAELLPFPPLFHPGTSTLFFSALTRGLLGFPDEALRRSLAACDLALRSGDALARARTFIHRSATHYARMEPEAMETSAQHAIELSEAHKLPTIVHLARLSACWARVVRGHAAGEALDSMRAALEELSDMHVFMARTHYLALTADVCRRLGRWSEGLDLVDAGLQLAKRTGEFVTEPELWRIRALLTNSHADRINSLERAIASAQAQASRWWQLRSTLDLVDSVRGSEERSQVLAHLRTLYASFAEGFDLPDLVRARETLSRHSA